MKLLLYPDGKRRNWKYSKVKLYVAKGGIKVTNNFKRKFDVALYWSYHRLKGEVDGTLKKLIERDQIINAGCIDIRKSKVEQVMKKAFGYNAVIDPKKEPLFIEKSELQAAHVVLGDSARIITEFEGEKEGFIYLKLIDNRVNDFMVRDYRVYYFDGRIPFVRTTDKPIDQRFRGSSCGVVKVTEDIESLFSKKEIAGIKRFCKLYPVDFTELDVIRDKDDRIYIVDNNPVAGNSKKNPSWLLDKLSLEFSNMLENFASKSRVT